MIIRLADKDDCRDLWLWRTAPEVSKWCCDSSSIEFEEHKKWFMKKIEDKDVRIYISENDKNEKTGQARFEVTGDSAVISVNLNPHFFGKGLGSELIEDATRIFLGENVGIREIVAEIKGENQASKKAFEKAGYGLYKTLEKQENKIDVYKFSRKD